MTRALVVTLTAALLLPACAGERLLPNVQTGKCYTVTAGDFGLMDLLIAFGGAVDGWRCQGLAVGDAYRTEETRAGVKIGTCPAPFVWNGTACAAPVRASVATPPATSAAPITWATGE